MSLAVWSGIFLVAVFAFMAIADHEQWPLWLGAMALWGGFTGALVAGLQHPILLAVAVLVCLGGARVIHLNDV